jgi:hypothetical protein
MKTWFLLALAFPGIAACSRSGPSDGERQLNLAASSDRVVEDLHDKPVRLPEGTVQVVSYDDPCKLAFSRSARDAGEDFFRANMFVRKGDLLPLGGHLVQVTDCRAGGSWGGHGHRSYAGLLMNPTESPSATPSPDSAFVPFHGEASIDGTFVARTSRNVPENPGDAPSVRLSADDAQHASVVYGHLRAGDAFAWGPHQAEVVRIVDEGEGLIGWVEVRVR